MPKEYYKLSYKTYFNDRVKKVPFQGKYINPLYLHVTYDRKSTTLKSYYFDLFSQSKYDFLKFTIGEMEQLESRVVDYVTNKYSSIFELAQFPAWYRAFSKDILDSFETPFKEWLISYFQKENVPSYAELLKQGLNQVCALELLDEFQITLASDLYERLMKAAAKDAPPYILLAFYVRDRIPKTPACLPMHEWIETGSQIIKDLKDLPYSQNYDLGSLVQSIQNLNN